MKEPNNFWRHGASPFQCRQYYPLRSLEFLRVLRGQRTTTGEASPEYLSKPGVARSVREVVPEVRLIFLFRDPVERAFSDHQMLVKAGVEKGSFRDRIKASLSWWNGADTRELLIACNGLEHHPGRYLLRGLYADNLVEWTKEFTHAKMLFVESEEMFENPQEVMKTVFGFLGLAPWEGGDWPILKKGEYGEDFDPELREELREFYHEPNQRLERITNRKWRWA